MEKTKIFELGFFGTSIHGGYTGLRGIEKIDTTAIFLLVFSIKTLGGMDLYGES